MIHYTANDGDSAKGNANYFKEHIVEASAHYFVDDSGVIQSVPDDSVAYSVGGKKYPSCSKTGGGKRYGSCTNRNSISIELCDTRKNGKYDFSEKTLENAAQLSRLLLKAIPDFYLKTKAVSPLQAHSGRKNQSPVLLPASRFP